MRILLHGDEGRNANFNLRHAFCSTCWGDWLSTCEDPPRCPLDKEIVDISKVFPDRNKDRFIRGLKVHCCYKDFGCGETPELRGLQNHMDACLYQTVTCELYCGKTMLLTTLQDHLASECPKRIVVCPVCQSEMEQHQLECHGERCSMKLLNCEFCEASNIPRKEMPEHHKNDCKRFPTYCSFALIGCTEKIVRESLASHHETHTQQHLHLLNSSLCHVYNDVIRGRAEPEGMTFELPTTLWGKIREEEAEAIIPWTELPGCILDEHKQPSSVTSLLDRVSKLENEKRKLLRHIDHLPDILVEDQYNICPCKWRVCVQKDMEYEESPFFYTKDGYKMVFHAETIKDESIIRVGVVLRKGDQDNKLEWPWKGEETLTIKDFRTGKKQYIEFELSGASRPEQDNEENGYYLKCTNYALNKGQTVLILTMS